MSGANAGFGQSALAVTSGNVANAPAQATLPAAAGKRTWITGFVITSDGATAGLAVDVTVTGPANTLHFAYTFPAGAAVQSQPLVVNFPAPIPSAAVNTAIVVTLPASGAGGTNAAVNAFGFQA